MNIHIIPVFLSLIAATLFASKFFSDSGKLITGWIFLLISIVMMATLHFSK